MSAGHDPAEAIGQVTHYFSHRSVAFDDLLLGGLVSMLIFVGILLLGLAYAWRKGALTWR